jgi:hypothetical protein
VQSTADSSGGAFSEGSGRWIVAQSRGAKLATHQGLAWLDCNLGEMLEASWIPLEVERVVSRDP